MKKMLVCLSLACALFAADNTAKFEFSPTLNYNYFEGNLDMKNKYAPGFRLGYHFDDFWLDQLEFGFEYYNKIRYTNEQTTNITRNYLTAIKGVDLNEKFYFYGLAGAGYEHFSKGLYKNKSTGFGHYGAGLKYKLSDSVALKLETRDQVSFNNANHNLVSTLGISFSFGKKSDSEEIEELSEEGLSSVDSIVDDEENSTVSFETHFDSDKSTSNDPNFERNIENLARILNEKENERYNTILEGHTDSTGSKAYNQKLSERRAQSVAKALEENGVSSTRIQTKGYGKERPRSSNETEAGRADNRRVEASFILEE